MNQFGSERRMKLALDVDSLDAIATASALCYTPRRQSAF